MQSLRFKGQVENICRDAGLGHCLGTAFFDSNSDLEPFSLGVNNLGMKKQNRTNFDRSFEHDIIHKKNSMIAFAY